MRLARRHGGSNVAGGSQAFSETSQFSRHTAGRQLSVASLMECRGEGSTGCASRAVCSKTLYLDESTFAFFFLFSFFSRGLEHSMESLSGVHAMMLESMQTSNPSMLVATVSYLVWHISLLAYGGCKARVSGAPRTTDGAKTMYGSCHALPYLALVLP